MWFRKLIQIAFSMTLASAVVFDVYFLLHPSDKVVFIDIIIEDDAGETEEQEEVVPYQLSKEAVMMDVKVKDIKVCCVFT